MLTKTHLDNIIKHNDLGTLESVSPLSGGDTSNCLKLTTERGIYVLKHPTTPVPEDFLLQKRPDFKPLQRRLLEPLR